MNKIIYITSPNSQEIHIWKIDENESLKLIQILKTSYQAHPIIIHPNKKILYVGTRPVPKIISFGIGKNGCLDKIKEFRISSYSTHLNIDILGTMLYSTSYTNNSLSIIKLNDLGQCVSISQILTGLMGCHSSKIGINDKKLWIPCLKEDCIRLYDIDKIGIVNKNSFQKINTEKNSGPRHMEFDYSFNYAYLINELNSTVNVIKIYSLTDSLPKIIQTINIIPENYNYTNNIKNYWAADIHITPDNHWIYCSDRYANIISYLEILKNNKKDIKLYFRGYQETEIQPRGCAIDNQGKYLFVAGQKSNFVSVYKINKKNGKLSQLFRFPSGEGPVWIAIFDQ